MPCAEGKEVERREGAKMMDLARMEEIIHDTLRILREKG